jgi:hypothetical protein
VQGFLLGPPVPVADFDADGAAEAARAVCLPAMARAAGA